MTHDSAYGRPVRGRLEHRYGPNVHLLSDPWALGLLARLGSPEVEGLVFHQLLESAYRRLLHAVTEQLDLAEVAVPTRMAASEPRAVAAGVALDPKQRVVVVDIARGGMIPAVIFQRGLLEVLEPGSVRVDHVYMQRVTDASGHVSGVETAGSKIGGPVEDTTVLIPDPMAATGVSVGWVLDLYRTGLGAPPKRIVACHLIVTPEYLRRMREHHPDVVVYALRVDRGLSAPDVLETIPGARWDEERGLDDHDYIVPGAGGLGEVINNCFV